MTLKIVDFGCVLNCSDGHDVLGPLKTWLQEKDEAAYQEWKEKEFDINYQFNLETDNVLNKLTLLHIAIKLNNEKVVEALLKIEGINVNVQDSSGQTPLHFAICFDEVNIVIVRALLKIEGIDVNVQNKYGYAPLHFATFYDTAEIVEALLKLKVDVNVRDERGETPLHKATQLSATEIVKALLEVEKIDVNVQSIDGKTPLDDIGKYSFGACEEEGEIKALLIKAGACSSKKTPEILAKKDEKNNKDENVKKDEKNNQVATRSVKSSIACGAIAGLTLGIGCGVVGVELPTLAIIGIAVAAALVVGLVTYALSKPSNELNEPNAQGQGKEGLKL